jgi:hypothetical protein
LDFAKISISHLKKGKSFCSLFVSPQGYATRHDEVCSDFDFQAQHFGHHKEIRNNNFATTGFGIREQTTTGAGVFRADGEINIKHCVM